MERQTLQQQTPIYHVCQQCGGEGCEACSDLCILDGDIHLDPELDEEIPSVTPINGVIGITARAESSCQCDDPDAKFYCIQCHPYWGYGDTSADPSSFEVPACPHCGKIDYDLACDCLNPVEYSPAVGDWLCCMPGLSGAVSVSINCGIGGEK
ncbi:hypothetical protein ACK3Y2_14665 [Aeromonas caviae]